VSDVRLPALTDFQLIRKVKDLRPEMKVVMMTILEVHKQKFETVFPSSPLDDVIRKPLVASLLVEKIRSCIGLVAQTMTTRMDAGAYVTNHLTTMPDCIAEFRGEINPVDA
jgi:DNA-binding NtrC family response regulator